MLSNRKLLYLPIIILLLFACSKEKSELAQGYIEGRYTYIASNASGILEELTVVRGSGVKKGQKLAVLDPQPELELYRSALAKHKEAISERDAIAANVEYAKLTFERYKILVPQKAIQQSQLDNARSTYNNSLAQLAEANAAIASAKANLAQAEWSSDQKILTAPADAIVFDTYYRLGEYTIANRPVLSLLAPSDIKAIFYIKEEFLGKIKLRDSVTVHCDNCKKNIKGKISFISPTAEYTPPVIYDNKTNAKLIYRIEADFAPADASALHPGQPISVNYLPHD